MSHTRYRNAAVLVACATSAVAAAALASPAGADAPPPSWANERTLACDGQIVSTYLTPGGFGTPFAVVGTNQVIIPKHVEVVFVAGTDPVVTVDVPGFDSARGDAVHCTYVDPVGLAVDFWGLRR